MIHEIKEAYFLPCALAIVLVDTGTAVQARIGLTRVRRCNYNWYLTVLACVAAWTHACALTAILVHAAASILAWTAQARVCFNFKNKN
jgi:hypothetical protein